MLLQNVVAKAEEWDEFKTISHPQKQLEWLTGRYVMQLLVESKGLPYEGMVKDEYGKPHLRHRIAEISITHTVKYVGLRCTLPNRSESTWNAWPINWPA